MAHRRKGSGSLQDPDLLKAALVGYERQRTEIETKIAELRRRLGGHWASVPAQSSDGARGTRARRHLSAAARKRIADAQRKRWAAYRNEHGPATAKKTVGVRKAAARPKRGLSAAARKRISEATKKRWAAYRAKKAAPKVKTAGA